MPKKDFEFFSSNRNSIVVLHLSFVLIPVKADSILKKQSHKKDIFKAYNISYIEIIFILLIEIVTLYIQVPIIESRVFSLEKAIARYKVCLQLAMLLALDK